MSESKSKIIMEQLLLAVDFLHQKGVVHRDIKLDNILISKIDQDEGELIVKIADFGLSTLLPEDTKIKLKDRCGTPCYIAPEALRGEGYREKFDIFSLGSVFFNLLCGHFLFNGETVNQQLLLNRECDLTLTYPYLTEISEPC